MPPLATAAVPWTGPETIVIVPPAALMSLPRTAITTPGAAHGTVVATAEQFSFRDALSLFATGSVAAPAFTMPVPTRISLTPLAEDNTEIFEGTARTGFTTNCPVA